MKTPAMRYFDRLKPVLDGFEVTDENRLDFVRDALVLADLCEAMAYVDGSAAGAHILSAMRRIGGKYGVE